MVFSGRDLNWRATYEHAAERLMARLEREAAWAAFRPKTYER